MKVGLTYDLRDEYLAQGYGEEETAELDKPDTIEGIESALRKLGFIVDRIGHVKSLMARLLKGDRWDIVFNIAEGIQGVTRESQVPALLEVYGIPYTFSDSLILALSLNKTLTKRVLQTAGVNTPAFAEVRAPADIAPIRLPYPLFAKPVAEGTGKGITNASRIADAGQLRKVCLKLLRTFRQPVLVETYLPGEEYTVGILGTGRDARVAGVMAVRYRGGTDAIYSYKTKKNYEDLVDYTLARPAAAKACGDLALKAWNALGCADAGRVDIRYDNKDKPSFIEVNPLAGLNPVHSDLPILCRLNGLSFDQLIGAIMKSALKRRRIIPACL
ncbi:MAG: D-alanine--D-alanine ligase [Kiritimatiellia bacterium]